MEPQNQTENPIVQPIMEQSPQIDTTKKQTKKDFDYIISHGFITRSHSTHCAHSGQAVWCRRNTRY